MVLMIEAFMNDGVSSKHQIEYADTSLTRAVHGDDAKFVAATVGVLST